MSCLIAHLSYTSCDVGVKILEQIQVLAAQYGGSLCRCLSLANENTAVIVTLSH